MGRPGYIGEKYVKNLLEKDGWHVIWTGNQTQMSEDQFGCDLVAFKEFPEGLKLMLVQVKSTKGKYFYIGEREHKQLQEMSKIISDNVYGRFYFLFRCRPKNILKTINIVENITLPKKICRDKDE